MTIYLPGSAGNGGPNAQQDTTTGTSLGVPLNSPPPLNQPVTSWNLSPWTSASGAFTQTPTLNVNGQAFTSANPQDYISRLQQLKSQGATGPVDQFIQQFQSAFPTQPAPNQTAAPVAAPVTPAATPAASTVLDHPSTVLQPGSTDTASVKALQDYLVAHGYMTSAQEATGPGTYGPQTTAAVLALQKNLGIDFSSGPGYFGPLTIAALNKTHNATTPATGTTAPVPPVVAPVTAPNGTTAPVVAPVTAPVTPPANTTTTPTAVPTITQNLGPGSTGADVTALQNYLLQQGYSIPALQNGTAKPGFYGAETQAAVTQWQKDMEAKGILKPVAANDLGYFGPLSKAALAESAASATAKPNAGDTSTTTQQPQSDLQKTVADLRSAYGLPAADPTKSTVQQAIDDYQQVYTSLGIPTIKQSYTDAVNKFTKLSDELNKKIADVRDDPWLSQGIADKKIENLNTAYDGKLKDTTAQITLFDSLVKEGVTQANNIISQVHQIQTDNTALINQAISIVQKKADAATALAKDNQVVTIGNQEVLVNKETGKQVMVLGPSAASVKPAKTATETLAAKNAAQADDVAGAIVDFQNQISTKNWKGANPDAYNYYKSQLTANYGASAALALDAAMKTAGITVDNGK